MRKQLQGIVASVEAIEKIHYLRARMLGDKIWVDVGVEVSAGQTVRTCQVIRVMIDRALREKVEGMGEVFVHFESAAEG